MKQTLAKLSGKPLAFAPYPEFTAADVPQTVPCQPAIFNRDHLSRVTQCGFSKPLQELIEVLEAREYVERPLSTCDLGPATVVGGIIFTPDNRILHSSFLHPGLRDITATPPEVSERTVLINSMQGIRYFGHWLSDDVAAHEAFRGDSDLRALPLPGWSDARIYSRLFEQDWQGHMVIRSKALTLVRDLGFSLDKARRYRALRQRMRDNLGQPDERGKVVFLKRGPSGDPREIVNAAELETQLSAAGVMIVTAEGESEHFLRSMLDASVIITIEGSQDRHAIYALQDGGGMLTIAPPDRFYIASHEWARNLDMHSGIVIGTVAEGGFTVDPNEILSMVDQLLARVENPVQH
ncbi:glycosyltransferase family 61 protein [Paracoccus caeni]|uniref:Glycosyltransferase family 61 protein n=1 Tax=Paracoccus caeni TaxID=657651 RepID=A0A934SCE3_9RHOB|nr:glycosyltransferase 61 family protein [Paracoccus caeni]MBK4214765.1 glycosyltransferase family 61 protein [Paracoccus caeni]